jgi:hypothetical protein
MTSKLNSDEIEKDMERVTYEILDDRQQWIDNKALEII